LIHSFSDVVGLVIFLQLQMGSGLVVHGYSILVRMRRLERITAITNEQYPELSIKMELSCASTVLGCPIPKREIKLASS